MVSGMGCRWRDFFCTGRLDNLPAACCQCARDEYARDGQAAAALRKQLALRLKKRRLLQGQPCAGMAYWGAASVGWSFFGMGDDLKVRLGQMGFGRLADINSALMALAINT